MSPSVRDFLDAARNWTPHRRDPLTLDLDNDGLEAHVPNPYFGVQFDHDGDGAKSGSGWIGSDDAFLVLDRNGNGIIDNGTELFGDATPIAGSSNARADDGFDALRQEDTNNDGAVDALDARFANLRLWRDLNQDGISQAGELLTLASQNITRLYTGVPAGATPRLALAGDVLVIDRNGNGSIDLAPGNNADTFAQGVTLSNGATAVNALLALKDEDTNNDGILNASDTRFAQLRLWRDTNGDGLAQVGELATLASRGIVSFSTAETRMFESDFVSQGVPRPNRIGEVGLFERSVNGQVSLSAMGDLDLMDAPFRRTFATAIPLTTDAKALPDMQGSGWVRDLREAMSLANGAGGTPSAAIVTAVTNFAAGTTRAAQRAHLDAIVQPWALSSGKVRGLELASGLHYDVPVVGAGKYRVTPGTATSPVLVYEFSGISRLVTGSNVIVYDNNPNDGVDFSQNVPPAHTAAYEAMNRRLKALEVFNATPFVTPPRSLAGDPTWSGRPGYVNVFNNSVALNQGGNTASGPTDYVYTVALSDTQVGFINNAYDALVDSVYVALAKQTRLAAYMDQIELGFVNGQMTYNFAPLAAKFDANFAADKPNALIDLAELLRYNGDSLRDADWVDSGLGKLRGWADAVRTAVNSGDTVLAASLAANGIRLVGGNVVTDGSTEFVFGGAGNDTIDAANGADLIFGGAGNDRLIGHDGSDALFGEDGNDTLEGGEGGYGNDSSDLLDGGAGDDWLYGRAGADTLFGGAGNDFLSGNDGDDILDGGVGDDTLEGAEGSDVYRFGRGGGHDTIDNSSHWERTDSRRDVLQFAPDVRPQDVRVERLVATYDSATFRIIDTNDTIVIAGEFWNDGLYESGFDGLRSVEEVRFADGTVWNLEEIKRLVTLGTAGNDQLLGFNFRNDVIDGLAGDDQISGWDGNDTLRGGAGIDILRGDGGNDVLDGGAGNDELWGNEGADTYIFGRGYGNDVIANINRENADVIQMLGNVLPGDIAFGRYANDIVLTIRDTGDSIRISGDLHELAADLSGAPLVWHMINEVRFADGTAWNYPTLLAKLRTVDGTAGNDVLSANANVATIVNGGGGNDNITGNQLNGILSGNAGNDTIWGGSGHETINGGDGDDALYGGAGVDYISGGAGNDILKGGLASDADPIASESDRDVLDGGTGDDYMAGGWGGGPDDYIHRRGDGVDTIEDNAGNFGGRNRLILPDMNQVDIKAFEGSGIDLQIRFSESTQPLDAVRLYAHLVRMSQFNDLNIYDVQFADATTRTLVSLMFDSGVRLGNGDDVFTGPFSHNSAGSGYKFYGEGGNDKLTGQSGNDVLDGGAGNDKLIGQSGNDMLDGGDGNDSLSGGDGDDSLVGGAGNDSLYGGSEVDSVTGEPGSDTLSGGTGADLLKGGYNPRYKDTYIYRQGDGIDTIDDAYGSNGSTDRLKLPDYNLANLQLIVPDGNDLVLRFSETDKIRLDYGLGRMRDFNDMNLYDVEFADGTVMKLTDLFAIKGIYMGAGDDFFGGLWSGTVSTDRVFGEAGNDRLEGRGGDDILDGGAGNDTLLGGDGNDVLDGGEGGDSLSGGDGDDSLVGGAGNDSLYGGSEADSVTGEPGSDTLSGGTGADLLKGGYNPLYKDTYIYRQGDGIDTIDDAYGTHGSTDRLKLPDYNLANLQRIERDGNDFVLKFSESDKIKLDVAMLRMRDFNDMNLYDVEFADGTVMKLTDLFANKGIYMGAADDFFGGLWSGTVSSDQVFGEAGNDRLEGRGGDDILDGGAGNDTLRGGVGNDVLSGGTGNDVLEGEGSEAQASPSGLITRTLTVNAKGSLASGVGPGMELRFNGVVAGTFTVNNTADYQAYSVILTYAQEVGHKIDIGFTNDALDVNGNDRNLYLLNATLDGNTLSPTSAMYDLGIGAAAYDGLNVGTSLGGTMPWGGSLRMQYFGSNDTLDGGAGQDQMFGGLGNDTYIVDDLGDQVTEAVDAGIDSVNAGVSFTLAANVENLLLTGTGAINGTGNELANILTGNGGNNSLSGGAGNDLLDGMAGADVLVGGAGDDSYYVDSAGDIVTESVNEGTDTVYSSISYALGANVEQLILQGNATSGTGNSANNIIYGTTGANILDGGTGADGMTGSDGDDTYYVDNAGDVVTEYANAGTDTVNSALTYALGTDVENLNLTGTGAIGGTGNILGNNITGNVYNNSLDGGAGNDTLRGGGGDDSLIGGGGNDVLYGEGTALATGLITRALTVNAKGSLASGVGPGMEIRMDGVVVSTFTVNNTVDYQAYVVNLTYAQDLGHKIDIGFTNDAVDASGNDRNLYLLNATLDGNTLSPSAAMYDLGNGAAAYDGLNVRTSIGGTMPWGGSLRLQFFPSNDTLDGGSGQDQMFGGLGNDTYVVDDLGDQVTEAVDAGFDTVKAGVSFALSANIEQLLLTGTGAISGTGNELANILTGNSGNNILSGGAGNDVIDGLAGADVLAGGAGDDSFYVDNAADVVNESLNEGTDTVYSSVSYVLGANVEQLILQGTAASGTGNAANNIIYGTTGANSLDGGTGADNLLGSLGNDTYYVDNVGDIVTEYANAGNDWVNSTITYILGTNVENLNLTGSGAINGTGNSLANLLAGNAGANILTGGAGNDTYYLGRGGGADTIVENDATSGNTDLAKFLSGVTNDQLWFRQIGNDLEASVIGTADKTTVKDWYLGAQYHVEQFKTTDGNRTLLESQVQNLVNAMASFAPPAAGQTTLPSNYASTLNPLIAANWQ